MADKRIQQYPLKALPSTNDYLLIADSQDVDVNGWLKYKKVLLSDFDNVISISENITYDDLLALKNSNNLVIGKSYNITDKSLLVIAVSSSILDEIAIQTTDGNNVAYDITTDTITPIQQTQINGTGFVKASGTTLSYDNNTYLTTIEGIAAGGELEGNYASPTLKNSSVVGKVLTGLSVTGSAVVSTDSVLAAIGKLQNQVNGLAGGVEYQGTWNASTNTPTLTSSVGTQGFYYVVSVAGSTNLNGITSWELGDWAIFNGSTWQKVDNTDAVVSVNGYTGIVTLSATDVSAVPTSAISGTSGTIPLFGASNTLGDSVIKQVSGDIITNNATDTGEHFIIGGSARVNGTQLVTGAATFSSTVTAADDIRVLSGNVFALNRPDNGASSEIYTNASNELILSTAIGGTMTLGSGATFSSSVTVNGSTIIGGTTSSGTNINLYASSYGSNGLFNSYGTDGNLKFQAGALGLNEAFIYTPTSAKISIFSGGVLALELASNQAATFSSSVTAGADATINGVTVGRGAGNIASNTAVGASALNANTTGAANVAVGSSTLTANTTGNGNASFGSGLASNTTGSENTAIGSGYSVGSPLQSNTTGSFNTALGSTSLKFNTTGSNNTGIGWGALLNNTASNNTAVGFEAGFTNTSGTGVTALGYQTLKNSTGSNNTAIGLSSGASIISGGNNVLIGNNTDISYLSNSDSVVLGASARGASSSTVIGRSAVDGNDASIVIGRGATSTASNQFVVGSAAYPAGAVATEVNASTKVWNVVINGVAQKILLA